MVRRWWKWILLAAAPMALMCGFDRLQTIDWVGRSDLIVEFFVTSAANGNPIPNASIEVKSDGGFYHEPNKQEFVLITNSVGVASKECRDCMCIGSRSGLGISDTFVVHLPWWRFRVVAKGYAATDWADLDVPQYIRQAMRAAPGRAKLVIPVSLQAAPGAAAEKP